MGEGRARSRRVVTRVDDGGGGGGGGASPWFPPLSVDLVSEKRGTGVLWFPGTSRGSCLEVRRT